MEGKPTADGTTAFGENVYGCCWGLPEFDGGGDGSPWLNAVVGTGYWAPGNGSIGGTSMISPHGSTVVWQNSEAVGEYGGEAGRLEQGEL